MLTLQQCNLQSMQVHLPLLVIYWLWIIYSLITITRKNIYISYHFTFDLYSLLKFQRCWFYGFLKIVVVDNTSNFLDFGDVTSSSISTFVTAVNPMSLTFLDLSQIVEVIVFVWLMFRRLSNFLVTWQQRLRRYRTLFTTGITTMHKPAIMYSVFINVGFAAAWSEIFERKKSFLFFFWEIILRQYVQGHPFIKYSPLLSCKYFANLLSWDSICRHVLGLHVKIMKIAIPWAPMSRSVGRNKFFRYCSLWLSTIVAHEITSNIQSTPITTKSFMNRRNLEEIQERLHYIHIYRFVINANHATNDNLFFSCLELCFVANLVSFCSLWSE